MDEKGFLIGYCGKTRRIYSKEAFKKGKIIGNTQDGSREWVTILASICADGTDIPPSIIYQAITGNLQTL
jgi:hypothetical protein